MIRVAMRPIIGMGVMRIASRRITIAVGILRRGRSRHHPQSKRAGRQGCPGKNGAPEPAPFRANRHPYLQCVRPNIDNNVLWITPFHIAMFQRQISTLSCRHSNSQG
jgi:hypothetical protein